MNGVEPTGTAHPESCCRVQTESEGFCRRRPTELGVRTQGFPGISLVLPVRIELTTSPLPRGCSTTELRQRPGRNPLGAKPQRIHNSRSGGKAGAGRNPIGPRPSVQLGRGAFGRYKQQYGRDFSDAQFGEQGGWRRGAKGIHGGTGARACPWLELGALLGRVLSRRCCRLAPNPPRAIRRVCRPTGGGGDPVDCFGFEGRRVSLYLTAVPIFCCIAA